MSDMSLCRVWNFLGEALNRCRNLGAAESPSVESVLNKETKKLKQMACMIVRSSLMSRKINF